MSHTIRNLILALLLLVSPALAAENKTKVACVGDSITFGACVANRGKNCYPVVLNGILGDKYEVKNFGVSGATLLKKGDNPYWKQGAFKQATDFAPDIVIIKLGSNDTKPQNWKHKEEFEADYKAMVEHFKSLPSNPKIYIALPVPALKSNFGINEKNVLEQQPMIRKVAEVQGATLINLHATINKPEQFDGDGIHPNATGAKAIAENVAKALGVEPPVEKPATK